jgi:hypothetical protein
MTRSEFARSFGLLLSRCLFHRVFCASGAFAGHDARGYAVQAAEKHVIKKRFSRGAG